MEDGTIPSYKRTSSAANNTADAPPPPKQARLHDTGNLEVIVINDHDDFDKDKEEGEEDCSVDEEGDEEVEVVHLEDEQNGQVIDAQPKPTASKAAPPPAARLPGVYIVRRTEAYAGSSAYYDGGDAMEASEELICGVYATNEAALQGVEDEKYATFEDGPELEQIEDQDGGWTWRDSGTNLEYTCTIEYHQIIY